MTISRNELTAKALEFIAFLAEQNFKAALDEQSFRDYSVKLRLGQGLLSLYHKPSKNSFSIGTQEYQGDKFAMEKLWHAFVYPHEQHVTGLCAYVDGSFHKERCAWGLVLAEEDSPLAEFSGIVAMNSEDSARQIAGEVTAVLKALDYAAEKSIKSLSIFFDYNGLQFWAQGKWKAQSPIAQFYVAKLMQYKHIAIHWHKVEAHTGHPFNSRADRLAKEAAESITT